MNLQRIFLKVLIDLRFAIGLLVLIAVTISIGSIIEQDQSTAFYISSYPSERPLFGFLFYKVIFLFELDHIYRSWFFLSLLSLLGCSLMFCTIKQQLPNLALAKDLIFFKNSKQIAGLSFSSFILLNSTKFFFAKNLGFLYKSNFYLHHQKKFLYALKGLFGKSGPILVHFSLICIFVGAFIGALGGFNAQEFISKGEIIYIQNIFSSGVFTHFPGKAIRLNDFWIEYSQQKINQYYSFLSLLDGFGREQYNGTISVNHPMSFQSITFYQTDWNILGLRIQKNNNFLFEYPVMLLSKNPKIWVSSLVDNNGNFNFLIVDDFRQNAKIYDEVGNFLKQVSFGDGFSFSYSDFQVVDLIVETGLQIKFDPSIPIIFLGFAGLMGSTLLSYMTFSEYWLYITEKQVFLGGETTRTKTDFSIFFSSLVKELV